MSFFRDKNEAKEGSGDTIIAVNSENTVSQDTPPSDKNVSLWIDTSKL